MKELDKILNQIEASIDRNVYLPVETERIELKASPPNKKESSSLLKSVCAFLNTNDGILIVGIRDNNNVQNKHYDLKGYVERLRVNIKESKVELY